jgi:hypothetical protein
VRIKNSVSSSNRDTPKYVVERRSRRLVLSILTAGLVLGILIASFLSVESGLAAGAVADEPCLSCPLEANAEEREADFYFLDHELAFFGRKASASIAEKERGADFYFLDHELAFFGR